jgi:hypothetical protein
VLQKRYCVAAMQHRIPYNVIMSLPFSGRVAANVPVLMAAGNRARIEFLPRGSALVVLAIALILAAVVWARQCARTRLDSQIDQAAGRHGTRSASQAMKRMAGRLGGSRVPSRAARFAVRTCVRSPHSAMKITMNAVRAVCR